MTVCQPLNIITGKNHHSRLGTTASQVFNRSFPSKEKLLSSAVKSQSIEMLGQRNRCMRGIVGRKNAAPAFNQFGCAVGNFAVDEQNPVNITHDGLRAPERASSRIQTMSRKDLSFVNHKTTK